MKYMICLSIFFVNYSDKFLRDDKIKSQGCDRMYQYNEYDESQVKRIQQERKNKKRRKIRKILSLIFIIIAILGILLSPALKFKSIEVKGEDEDIVSSVEESLSSYQNNYYPITSKKSIKKVILKNPRLKDAQIEVSLLGNMTVHVVEAKNIAFAKIGKKTYYLNEIGKIVELEKKETIDQTLPQCMGFKSEDILQQFVEAYKDVPSLVMNDISEISFIPKKYDPLLVKFTLNNNNFIKIRIDEMNRLSSQFDYSATLVKYPQGYTFSFEGSKIYISKNK